MFIVKGIVQQTHLEIDLSNLSLKSSVPGKYTVEPCNKHSHMRTGKSYEKGAQPIYDDAQYSGILLFYFRRQHKRAFLAPKAEKKAKNPFKEYNYN